MLYYFSLFDAIKVYITEIVLISIHNINFHFGQNSYTDLIDFDHESLPQCPSLKPLL